MCTLLALVALVALVALAVLAVRVTARVTARVRVAKGLTTKWELKTF